MKYWTDYPFTRLGDVAGKQAPIRQIELLAYDQDKYVTIEVEGLIEEIKSGYIYTTPVTYDQKHSVPMEAIKSLPNYP